MFLVPLPGLAHIGRVVSDHLQKPMTDVSTDVNTSYSHFSPARSDVYTMRIVVWASKSLRHGLLSSFQLSLLVFRPSSFLGGS